MIHIVFNCDDIYKEYLSTVIKSIKMNTQEPCTFHVIGLDEYKDCICYPAPNISMLECIKENGYLTKTTLYRLFIPDLINVDKVIYLDIDIIVLSDIKELWDIPCKYISACKDATSERHMNRLNINKPHYVNTGILLMNLNALREDKTYLKKLIEASRNPRLTLLDQDILNEACEIDLLSPEWNTYTLDLGQKYIENPKILHCIGPKKFWNADIRGTKEWEKIRRING